MADRGQLERWAKEHDRAMLAVAARYQGPSTTAEDIRQAALLSILQKLEEIGEVLSPKGLLLGYVKNVGRNRRRKRERREAILQAFPFDRTLTAEEPPPRDPRIDAVLSAIEHLPAQQRRTLRHMVVDEMPDERIAKAMEVTAEAVRSSRFRAIQALRAACEA
jgi:RNA polymerase sigma factor (sigma-70 family)